MNKKKAPCANERQNTLENLLRNIYEIIHYRTDTLF